VALSLAKQGKKVTLVGKRSPQDLTSTVLQVALHDLPQAERIKAYNDCEIDEVKPGEIIVKTYDGYRFQ